MKTNTLERAVLDQIADRYRGQGYTVFLNPNTESLPDFLSGYQPDLLARSPSDSVVVEIKVGTETSAVERYRDIAERVNNQPGWRFSLVFVSPEHPDDPWESELPPLEKIRAKADKASGLLRAGDSETAFLLLWSVGEALLRLVSRRNDLAVENLPPSALIRELYSSGEMSARHFNTFKKSLPVRNRLAHGFDPEEDVRGHANELHEVVNELLGELPS